MTPGTLLVNNYVPSYAAAGGAPVAVSNAGGPLSVGAMTAPRSFAPAAGSPGGGSGGGGTIELQYSTGSGAADGIGYVTSGPGQALGYHGITVSEHSDIMDVEAIVCT
jgi:hypothetical protein